MKKKLRINPEENQQNKMVENALRTSGFLFPETVEEVLEFERIYGTTDVILPTELQEPTFLYEKSEKAHGSKSVKFHSENFAMVAREGSFNLPQEIKQKIIKDIKNTKLRRKKKK
jgi:hypothetical protein